MRPFPAPFPFPAPGTMNRRSTTTTVLMMAVGLLVVGGCSASESDAGSTLQTPQTVDGDLAFADDQVVADPELAAPTSTTVGSDLPPVTTIPGPSGDAPIDDYTGMVGTLLPDQQVVAPVADPPSVAAGHLPLTGLPGEAPDRPAAVVKIDNGAAASPQIFSR